jgi:5'-3' exonuclease
MESGSPRYEADDLIGTLVEHGRTVNRPSTIVSRDKDLAQLVSQQDVFWDFAGRGKIGYHEVRGVFGVMPEQIADFLALAGDAVDSCARQFATERGAAAVGAAGCGPGDHRLEC